MAKIVLNTVISIDPDESTVTFFSMTGNEKSTISSETVSYRARQFDSEFFEKFTDILRRYWEKHPSDSAANVTVLLPDRVIAQDTIHVPTTKRMAMNSAVDVAVERLYKNKKDLKVNTFLAAQNKQYSTYSLTMIRAQLLAAIYTACSTSKMMANTVTFASNALVNGVQTLVPKLKSTSYLLLDVKENVSHFAFVAKGRTVGSYSLPFGASIMRHNKLASEDMLFDHSIAELTVLNAKEKAKAKQLTMMGEDNATMIGEAEAADRNIDALANEDEDVEYYGGGGGVPMATPTMTVKTLPRKQPRKLPKFMLRPTPDTDEGYAYENFRIFVKWALTLIQGNDKLTEQGKPEAVIVNIDPALDYVIDMTNAEKDENGIAFQLLDLHNEKNTVRQNLELYGGFFTHTMNKNNNF